MSGRGLRRGWRLRMIPFLRSAPGTRRHHGFLSVALIPCLLLGVILSVSVEAAVVPPTTPLKAKEFRHPDLYISNLERSPAELGQALGPQALDLVRLGVRPEHAYYD